MTFNKKLKGFTLVEMLIVIVIIGVLAAALIPRLTSVRGRANDVARKADIQQLATAIITYQMDNNGKLPVPSDTGASVELIKGALVTAGMDGVPQDPLSSDNTFYINSGDDTTYVSGALGGYGYLRLVKDGLDNAGFVLIAKTQTAGGSNRVTDGTIGNISSTTSTENIAPCKTVAKVSLGSGVTLNQGGDCFYDNAAQLRYIMVR